MVDTEDSKSFPLHDVVKFNPFQEFMDYNEKKSKGEEIQHGNYPKSLFD